LGMGDRLNSRLRNSFNLSDDTAAAFNRIFEERGMPTAEDSSVVQKGNNHEVRHSSVGKESRIDEFKRFDKKESSKRASERGIIQEDWNGKTVLDFFKKYRSIIADDITALPTIDYEGIKFVADMYGESDMPFVKEVGAIKILNKLGFDAILLPRYADGLINKLYGITLKQESLPDGIILDRESKRFVEFKHIIKPDNFMANLNESLKAVPDIVFISVNDIFNHERLDSVIKNNKSKKNNIISNDIYKNTKLYVMSFQNGTIYEYKNRESQNTDSPWLSRSESRLVEWNKIPLDQLHTITSKYFVNLDERLDRRVISAINSITIDEEHDNKIQYSTIESETDEETRNELIEQKAEQDTEIAIENMNDNEELARLSDDGGLFLLLDDFSDDGVQRSM
ncbi:MAG: hypothetical protein ACQGQO_04805, partial [Sphaerochaetaceae bacterium]